MNDALHIPRHFQSTTHTMMFPYLHAILTLSHLLLAPVWAQSEWTDAVTTRFWDCCKPSCSWNGKASVSHPVQDCNAADVPNPNTDVGSGCKEGGNAYACNDQSPWAVNDTFSYGFAGVWFKDHPEIESYWCCACYQVNFTSDPLQGKTMIVQASNTAFDVRTENRFSLAIPGGNTTVHDGCTKQYGLPQTVFGKNDVGVTSSEACENLPKGLREPCKWRFDWFKDAQYPAAKVRRVSCPTELTQRSNCIRNDEIAFAEGRTSASAALQASSFPAFLGLLAATFLSA